MRPRVVAALAATVLLLAGCSTPGVSADYEGDGGGYISGDGTTRFWSADERADPVEFSGDTDQGGSLSSADLVGDVVLVNFWYASCGPCRTEAADLNDLFDEFADDGVAFVGVNTRDDAATARSFAEQFAVLYPSILDVNDNAVTLAFATPAPPTTTPTTFLLDKRGRVAARITSAIQSPSVVAAMISDLRAES